MPYLLAAHVLLALAAPLLVRRLGRDAFLVLALGPAAGFVWSLTQLRAVRDDGAVLVSYEWMPTVGLDLAFRLDALSLLLTVLVTGVGALVLAYCARYFSSGSAGLGRFAGVLVAFAGAMLGLVLADDMVLLYVFWELTSVFSYLLIGHSASLKAGRRAAMQALVVTTAGGLAMLVGIVMLGERAGTYSLSAVVAQPVGGTYGTVAVVLVLAGAVTKSAVFPFHFWLPAAMAAPTPVSAYLHAAAMVKAGVYLVARLAPGYADSSLWRPLLLPLGIATMLLGAWRALRQHDLKLLLAYGTVSQLGFLIALVAGGTADLALAGVTMLLAHALFKATLFLVVGIVDRTAGTRDLRELSGLGRKLPVLAVVAALAAASMAGLPPLLGFVGKEAAYAALLDAPELAGWVSGLALAGLVVGSMLTFAYSARFVWGAFADKAGVDCTAHRGVGPLLLGAPALLAALGLVAGPLSGRLGGDLTSYAGTVGGGHPHDLAPWHGLNTALGLSALTVAVGLALFVRRDLVAGVQARMQGPGDADGAYRAAMRGVDRLALAVTAATQRGSLPAYLGTILAVLVAVPGVAMLRGGQWPDELRAWDTPLQALVAAVALIAAVTAVRTRQRLTAVLLVGATGYGVGVLFVLHGAPDLALTQFLVESLTLVVFVLVLRKLPKQIVERHSPVTRAVRATIAVAGGLLLGALTLLALDARVSEPVSNALPKEAYEFGEGKNVVNVTLVDARAWDTFGEISVLTAAATGVASLVFLRKRTGAVPRASASSPVTPEPTPGPTPAPRRVWLEAGALMAPQRRSLVLEVIARLIFHTILVLSVYLLFAGHNVPGGGFAAGLVAGLALVVRYIAGGRYELGSAAPIDPGLLLGLGVLVSGATGVIGLLVGGEVLQTVAFEGTLPVLGDVKLVTSLFFDIGVYLVVVGLVLDILRSLGAELERLDEDEEMYASAGTASPVTQGAR
ncbi:Na+/H+ antiporter subunit A [Motilibacter aurantiacus]|uniref:Na+/H+ antiporter subunit A n=1 Tax=Motilibacter aurantiacus TaxID=2714955 RepID=UPI00140C25CA|nr:Na+/H+ antiporter subunit A [Motilibacter aurantiacus]NHC46975.1 Na+/H+ antiporter subunit A [Motilibacter aurantiacus]